MIEGAYRHLQKDRLERTGMRISTEGAQAMLNLRSLKASNAWDDFRIQCLNSSPSNPDRRKCGLNGVIAHEIPHFTASTRIPNKVPRDSESYICETNFFLIDSGYVVGHHVLVRAPDRTRSSIG